MTFDKEIQNKLGKYKLTKLHLKENGKYRNKECSHILSEKDAKKNFMMDVEGKIDNNILCINNQKIKLHEYWRHLNSSQVLGINYFYLLKQDKINFKRNIKKILGKVKWLNYSNIDANVTEIYFEDYQKIDGTSVDVKLELDNGSYIYIEIKYTESHFGPVKITKETEEIDKAKYKKKYDEYYSKEVTISFEDFCNDYQFVRNAILSKNNNYTIFLFPKANSSIQDHFEKCIYHINKSKNLNIGKLYWEDIVDFGPKEVKEKYFS